MAYPNNWVDDGKVWVYYDISEISSATTILNQTTNIGSTINVDGTDVDRATTYQFSATGEHLIKYTLSGSTWGQQLRNIKTITKVFFPSTVTVVGSYAFQGSTIVECHGEGITTVGGIAAGWGGGAFTQVTSLVVLDFPNLTTIQRGGCYGCTNLETFIGLEYVSSLAGYGINQCSKLGGDITFHNLTSLPNPGINDLAFTRVYLPKIVSSNGGSGTSNSGIGALHSAVFVEFGPDLTSIGNANLGSCENLRRVHILATTPPSLGSNFLLSNQIALIYVPAESLQSYKEASGWSSFASRIFPLGDEKRLNINHMSLGDFRRRIMLGISTPKPLYPDPWVDDGKVWCYYDVTTTESATALLNNSTTFSAMEVDGVSVPLATSFTFSSIGEHLIKFTLSNNTVLGDTGSGTFRSRPRLKRIYMPDTVVTVNRLCFYQNSGVTFIRFSPNVETLGEQACYQCTALSQKINLPELKTLGTGAFNTTRITKILSLGEITSLLNSTLRSISTLTDLVLPATLTSLADASVYYCSALKRVICYAVTPPSRVSNVFAYCSLEYIKVPSESVQAYKESSYWSSYANIIQAIQE